MPKGFHPSAETRAKMSQRKMGNKYSLGVHPSEATRKKLSLAHMGNQSNLGHKATAETRAKMSEARKGVPLSLEHRARISEAKMGSKNPMYGKPISQEHRNKLSEASKGRVQSAETRAKCRLAVLGTVRSAEARANNSLAQMGKTISEETKAKIGLAQRGKIVSEETKAKMRVAGRETQKRLWADPEHRCKQVKAIMAGWHIHPNKPEICLGELLESLYPGEWKFVGAGELIIDGKNPDFWNGDHKLIELYGNYFHKGENPQDRIDLFKQYGYSTLVIWEGELKEPEKVLEKIKSFA